MKKKMTKTKEKKTMTQKTSMKTRRAMKTMAVLRPHLPAPYLVDSVKFRVCSTLHLLSRRQSQRTTSLVCQQC